MAKKRTGLFDKLVILHLLSTSILFLIIIFSYYYIEKRNFDNSLTKKSHIIRDLLEISCIDPIVKTIAYDRVNRSIKALYQANKDIVYMELYDPTAHTIASVGDLPGTRFTIDDISRLIQQHNGEITGSGNISNSNELIAYLEVDGQNLGLIRVQFTRKYLYKQLRANIMFFLGVSILSIAATSLIFYFFTDIWVVSPIVSASNIMEKYGSDELHTLRKSIKKHSKKNIRDEIGVMSVAFERMISSIIKWKEEKEKAEAQYRLITENIEDVIWTMDMSMKFTYVSPSIYQQRGYTVEEAMKRTMEEVLAPDSLNRVMALLDRKLMLIEAGDPGGWESEVFEAEQYCKDGTTIWASNNAKIFPGPDGKPAGILGAAHNITDRKQAELALIESERNYREIFNATRDGIFIHDADNGMILDVNKGMLDMYGWTYDEVMHGTLATFSAGIHPYTLVEAQKIIKKAVQYGPQTFDWLCRKKDGTLFWGEVSLKYVEFPGKRYVLATTRDVNDRKLAEKSLAEEKERLAVTLKSIGDGVITTDISGNIVLLNKVAEHLTGWTNREAVGRPSDEVFHIVNEQTRELCDNPVTKVISNGKPVDLGENTVLIARDGRERSIADSGAPILDAKSKIIGVVLVFRDVTDKQRLEQEALKVRKLESVGVLAGGIAHDFNNILSAILGNISLALEYTPPHEPTHLLLAEAEKASLRAKDLTQQLLTFSRGGEPIRKTTSIAEIIKDSSTFVLRGSNVRCDTWFAPDLLPVEVDPGQISQVIQNIIINASHAMPDGGVVTIRGENVTEDHIPPSLQNEKQYIVITIRDHGTGIPQNIIDNIFDPYFSTKQTGNGLGLAICHSIIMRHEGFIAVESKPETGTVFSIYLVASKEKITDCSGEKPEAAAQVCSKIMVMDDDAMVQDISRAILTRLGHDYQFAPDGEEAVALYKKDYLSGNQADLIIMDLTIPGGMGGKDAVKEILAVNPEAKVLVSSGYSNDPIMANYEEYGFCGAIVKPYQMKELKVTIQEALLR
ncbi:hypothetical protein DGMP_30480 [Desulfomarina profundi]|uniref:histidine kinase n=1 Tax=Desulfomarina profundi TaxID=2772557 RepID=A0A8D5FRF8_9BACT|nr:PAS domain S-box protein [Desulfomarina profundi]BCL62355.1 hypothetical protein DGMP_30480 [Desulfomarina profundi]